MSRRLLGVALVALMIASVPAVASAGGPKGGDALSKIKHIVVIYEENHSFDNLYGSWEGVNGLSKASAAARAQINQAGIAFNCLQQNDVNLAAVTPANCTDSTTATTFTSAFTNGPFRIDSSIPASALTCPAPSVFAANGVLAPNGLAGGCTRDMVHRYYQEQYQLNGGAMNRYATGSDALGLTMGYYDTQLLPIYQYLHSRHHPNYAIADNFFQAAFGGSFLNHQWLIAAQTPVWQAALNDGSPNDLHSVVDASGMPNTYGLYTPSYSAAATGPVKDQALTASCTPGTGRGTTPSGVVCGDYAVNTIQPYAWPYAPGTIAAKRLPPLTSSNIGDELSAKGVDWAWYSGGWDNATGNTTGPGWTNGANGASCTDPNHNAASAYPLCPDYLFQYHHQPFNYYANYAPGTAARAAHLGDEAAFTKLADASNRSCKLKPVSFVKPLGEDNEHPGYASEPNGSDHLVDLLKSIENSACADNTMVVVTYDEFGGSWDHVPPPGQGSATAGPADSFGPGTRIPALILAPAIKGDFVVDHASHDTTSILATIEHRFGLAPISTRDARVRDLSTVFTARPVDDH